MDFKKILKYKIWWKSV